LKFELNVFVFGDGTPWNRRRRAQSEAWDDGSVLTNRQATVQSQDRGQRRPASQPNATKDASRFFKHRSNFSSSGFKTSRPALVANRFTARVGGGQ
jgi:hypothetical protein